MNANNINLNIDKLTVDKVCEYLNQHKKEEEFLQTMKRISSDLPDGEEQYNTIVSFHNGEMSYAEMRARCG